MTRALLLPVACCLLALLASCGKEGEEAPKACGPVLCNDHQTCDRSGAAPRCVCDAPYTGADCRACARGFVSGGDGTCKPQAIDCKLNPGVCGARGACFDGQGLAPDRCVCTAGYDGPTCGICADGHQDNDRNGTCAPSCKSTAAACVAPKVCTDTTGTASCACPGGATGAACDQCPTGHVRGGDGTCVRTCTANTACGTRRTCDAAAGVCVCAAGYTGPECSGCAEGYQDNDGNGTCTPSCQSMAATCGPPRTCSDAAGTAVCACPGNTTGGACEQCLAGFVRAPDGSCVKGCAAGTTACGPHRVCDTSQAIPACVCQVGWGGADCAACAAGYTADGSGGCARGIPAGTTLLGGARYPDGDYLLAIGTAGGGTATPLRKVANLAGLRLATDTAARVIYAGTGSGLSKLDPATGLLTPIASIGGALAVAAAPGAIFSIPNVSPYLLKKVELATGAVADLGPTTLAAAQGIVAEPAGTFLVARPGMTLPELARVDGRTGAATALGPLAVDGMRLRPSDPGVALAAEPGTGKLFLVARVGRTAPEIVAEHCGKLAAGLGLAGYGGGPYTTVETAYNGIGPGGTKILTSRGMAGREVVAYTSYGRRGVAKAILRVETQNPEAFVCLGTYEEVLELQIAAGARFAAIVFAGSRPTLSLVVEPGFPATTTKTLHVYGGSGSSLDPSVGAYALSRVYTTPEWTERRLPVYASVWDSDAAAPTLLMEIDPASRAIVRTLSFAGVTLLPVLAGWAAGP